jgi:hypothetical protein
MVSRKRLARRNFRRVRLMPAPFRSAHGLRSTGWLENRRLDSTRRVQENDARAAPPSRPLSLDGVSAGFSLVAFRLKSHVALPGRMILTFSKRRPTAGEVIPPKRPDQFVPGARPSANRCVRLHWDELMLRYQRTPCLGSIGSPTGWSRQILRPVAGARPGLRSPHPPIGLRATCRDAGCRNQVVVST